MYICNRCGCSAMAEIKKNLVCLNCGNEQKKALSRKRSGCVPNTHQHNVQTVKTVGAKASSATAPRMKTPKPAVPRERRKKQKSPLAKVITAIVTVLILVNIVLPLIFGVVSEVIETVSYELEPEITFGEQIDWDLPEDGYDPEGYQQAEDMPWYWITATGKLEFDDYYYFDEGNTETDLVLPSELNGYQVSVIAYDGFLFCEGIRSVTVPDSVKIIETDAFYGCEDLEEIWLPDSITHIYYDAVYSCDDLEAIYYAGTEAQWEEIYIEDPNDALQELVVFLGE